MDNNDKKLFLLDAMALIYRAYFALNRNPRINSKGLNTSAVLGFTNTLWDVLRNEKPTHIGVAFDTMAPTLRQEGFIEYKANREKMPEELAASIPIIKNVIEAFNIPILYADGYEADDVIGTLAKKAEKDGFTTFMMTPDKDFGQLVSENIFMFKPGKFGNKPEKMGVKEVCAKFGVQRPDQVIDMLGLWGDSSDNIPGIPGVGEVTARKLLAEFDNIENLIAKSDDIKNKRLQGKVKEFADQALQSKQLATIILDVPVEFDAEQLKLSDPDESKLRELFDELEFRTLAKRIFTQLSVEKGGGQQSLFEEEDDQLKDINSTKHRYKLLGTEEEILFFLSELETKEMFCFDTETTGLDAHEAELVGISFSWEKGGAFYLPVPPGRKEATAFLRPFKEIFENEAVEKTGQNLKYDISVLKWYDIDVKGRFFDTMLAHYLLEPDQRHNMDVLAENYLKYKTVPITDLIGKKGKNQGSMRDMQNMFPEKVSDYACEDADITLQLRAVFEPLLEETGTRELFDKLECPLIDVLADMEAAGVLLDVESLRQFSLQLQGDIAEVESRIYEQAGRRFNIASPKQLGIVLFEEMKITEKAKKTKTGQYSTSEDVLQKLAKAHPVINDILEYRSLSKLKSTYVDALPTLISVRDKRIHTSYNQAVAATGRLSSNNPNLQNIPIRTEKGREIRKAFVPADENHVLLAADYSQVELRIIAHLSGDEGMKEAFNHGLDIHTATASKVYDTPLDLVSKEQRRNAKMVNFGIVYGISAFGLSERLSIPRKEAAEIIKQYFEKYPGIQKYMDDTIAFAKENGYVETMMKRRRYLRDINSSNGTVRAFAERNAINAPVQGSSADMIKVAMIRIHKVMKEKQLQSKMILQVHDELVFDARVDELDALKEIVLREMKNAMPLDVPLVVDMNTGQNWLEAH